MQTRCLFLPLVVLLFVFVSHESKGESNSFKMVKNIDNFFAVIRELDLYYVDSIDFERAMQDAISGMLDKLDPYTVLIPETEVESFDMITTGQYGGIGAMIRKRDNYVEISEVYQNSPADKTGIVPGDKILKVDTGKVSELTVAQVSETLKGKTATEVSVTIKQLRTGDTTTFNIKREKIHLSSVPYYGMTSNKVGYVYFSTFTRDASNEVRYAVEQLKKQGAKSLILDLRNNSGGLLEEAVNITNFFIPKGSKVVSIAGKKTEPQIFNTTRKPLDVHIPIVVLINNGSASSSEIVAGALQDYDRAVVLGTRSFGKGLVQNVADLPYSDKLKITTAKYYTPSGRCVQAIDYEHRRSDGSVAYIPDSLTKVFTTENGRKVYDGGGILPDTVVEANVPPAVLIALYEQNIVTDFVSDFYRENITIDSISLFNVDEELYQKFVSYSKAKLPDYKPSVLISALALKQRIHKEGLEAESMEEMNNLIAKLEDNRFAEFITHKEFIEHFLEEEIVARYYYQAGRVQKSIMYDNQVRTAVSILKDTSVYRNLLKVKK